LAYPEPTPVLKGKAARELLDGLEKFELTPEKKRRWKGSRALFEKLQPKNEKA